jgi:hypothetical protein
MPRYRVTISGSSRDAMLALVREHKINVFDHGIRKGDMTGYLVDAIAEPAAIQKLEAAGYQVQMHEDVDEAGKERQGEVGQGNRYWRAGPV